MVVFNNADDVIQGKDTLKLEVPELDGLGYMEDVSGSLGNLLSSPLKNIKCVESIVFSSFNPPPSFRKLVGDLIYLDVIILEGNKFCITGSTKMFYVNSSSVNTLDPRPSKATFEATTLVLLQKISPKFKKAFREILEGKVAAHPFENMQSLLPPNSGLRLYPVPGTCTTIYSLVSLLMMTLTSCQRNVWMLIQKQGAQAFCKVLIKLLLLHFMETVRFPIREKMMVQVQMILLMAQKSLKMFLLKLSWMRMSRSHASANNDLKGTKAYQEADVPGLYSFFCSFICIM